MAPTPSVTNLTPPSREVTVLQGRRDSVGLAELLSYPSRAGAARTSAPGSLASSACGSRSAAGRLEREKAMVGLHADQLDAGTGDKPR